MLDFGIFHLQFSCWCVASYHLCLAISFLYRFLLVVSFRVYSGHQFYCMDGINKRGFRFLTLFTRRESQSWQYGFQEELQWNASYSLAWCLFACAPSLSLESGYGKCIDSSKFTLLSIDLDKGNPSLSVYHAHVVFWSIAYHSRLAFALCNTSKTSCRISLSTLSFSYIMCFKVVADNNESW